MMSDVKLTVISHHNELAKFCNSVRSKVIIRIERLKDYT